MDPDMAPDSPGDCCGHDPVLAPKSPAARKRKPGRLREEGAVGVAIMTSDTRGLCRADMIRSAAARPRRAKSATGVLGLVLTRLRLASTDGGRNEALSLHESECRRLQAGTLSGFVEYLCVATAVLLSPVHHGIIDPGALLKILEPFQVELPPVEDGSPERLSVRTLITRWRHQCEVALSVRFKAPLCHVVGMGQRVCRRLLVHMAPTKGKPKRFREFVAATEVNKDGATSARM